MEQIRQGTREFRRGLAAMRPAERRIVLGVLAALGLVMVAGLSTAGYLLHEVRRFPEAPFRQPSRLYASPTKLALGAAYSADDLVGELKDAGYREVPGSGPLPRGAFRQGGDVHREDRRLVAVHLRPFRIPDPANSERGDAVVLAAFAQGRVAGLRVDGRPAGEVEIEPPLLASFYGPEVEERKPVLLEELPEEVVQAVLAAEDDAFYVHPGVSIAGIVRAAWKNARGGEVQQGGSTLTQQLVKNLYLSRERTLSRKAKEAMMAVLIEARHGKKAILEAYLNEIYWGRSGPANLIGLGAAARAYFGKDARDLTLAEAATLAGMISAPADFSPISHPREARERRDFVLRRMQELGWVERSRIAAALATPLETHPETVVARHIAPYFADVAAAEARERFGIDDLEDEGYLLFSTLTWRDQRRAEEAVAQGLGRLEAGPERRRRGAKPLQAALVSVDPRDGSILAYVGGRDYAASQFDRVAQAHRQAGSAFKPVVYAAAFSEGVATPTTVLRDSPIVVRMAGQAWRPQNNDRGFHGQVTVRAALERSLNVPAVRVALQAGLGRIVELAHDMGIAGPLEPLPSLALGAFGATPRELAEVYATLANGGLRPPLHGIAAALDRGGEPLEIGRGDRLPQPRRVLDAQAAYLVTAILQGVIDHGTGQAARAAAGRSPLAGKTGTTNGRRDSWFAGYSPDRATVVWVGYDDNARTRLSGASAALPIWSLFIRAVRPARGFLGFTPPPGIVEVAIDPETGQLATENCPQIATEVFPEWQAPTQPCQRHQWGGGPWMEADLAAGGGWSGYDPSYGYGADQDLGAGEPGGTDGGEVGEVEIDTSQWDDPGTTPPAAGGGSIVIRPSRRAPPTYLPSEPAQPAGPAAPVAGASEPAAPADPPQEWQGYEDSEDWSDPQAPPPAEGTEPPPGFLPGVQPSR
jgi:penicillin-binding protein 1B